MRNVFGMTLDQISRESGHAVYSHRDGSVGWLPTHIWECLGTTRFSIALRLNDWCMGGTDRAAPTISVYCWRRRFDQLRPSLTDSTRTHLELVKQPVIQHT